jgi:hypothetical protein
MGLFRQLPVAGSIQGTSPAGTTVGRWGKVVGCSLALAILACSCVWQNGRPGVDRIVFSAQEITTPQADPAAKWIVSTLSERLKELLSEGVVHASSAPRPRQYYQTWGEETPHVELFFGDYAIRVPIEEIAGYPWTSVDQQIGTGEAGPALLTNGWQVWLGYIERADAISYDLGISVRETCKQLSTSDDATRDAAVRRLCSDFQKEFVFENDLELFRRLWRSSFHVAQPEELAVNDALASFFLADLKRLIAHPGAEEHVAEVWTSRMKGFEFGDETSVEGFSADLFDQQSHVTILFLPPMRSSEPPSEEFRQRVLASVRRHGRWAPGLDMIRQAEDVLQLEKLENNKDVATLLLFSALQFPDHKSSAARMLLKLFPPGSPGHEKLAAAVNALMEEGDQL